MCFCSSILNFLNESNPYEECTSLMDLHDYLANGVGRS